MSENNNAILLIEPHYLPSISWMQLAARYPVICFDLAEHHVKGGYRNRCHILSPNGKLNLSVPLLHGKHQRNTTGQVRISYEMDWRKNHWMTLMSSYRRSAYFEYFEDRFAPLYEKKFDRLIDLNLAMLEAVFPITHLRPEIRFSEQYIAPGTEGYDDFRNRIRPAIANPLHLNLEPYTQVFSDRFEFFSDLSIIDMIFNKGKIQLP